MSTAAATLPLAARPRLGFLGVGWIGRNRMEAMIADDMIEVAVIADASTETAREAQALAPGAEVVSTLDDLLAAGVDGVVIATPSALHAEQAVRALEAGAAVFCQKPLGRTAEEACTVVAAARRADRLLGVDLSYRHTEAMRRIRELVRSSALGRVYAADLVFHNAYGPDKAWFYDAAMSGGGCLIDLGVHLIDLALWVLDFPEVERVTANLFAGGVPIAGRVQVEDYALATLELAGGVVVRIACSWRLSAGCDAVISAAFHGSEGGAEMRNLGGSFYDFEALHYRGTSRTPLAAPPDAWGGRAAAEWARRLAAGERFDPAAEELVTLSATIDRIYADAENGPYRHSSLSPP